MTTFASPYKKSRKTYKRIVLGVPQLDALLGAMKVGYANRAVRLAQIVGAKEVQRLARKAAPDKSSKASVGYVVKMLRGRHVAKVGLNVGKRGLKQSPHAHLIALGTKERFRKRIGGRFSWVPSPSRLQLRTGRMPETAWFRIVAQANGPNITQLVVNEVKRRIIEFWTKEAKPRTRRP